MFEQIGQILLGLLGLGIIVLIHEFGHFIVAKALGIEVEVFSIGWGKRLWGFQRNGTDYRISVFPLGGYVRMKGETQYREAIQRGDSSIEGEPGSFFYAAPWKRILVALAGPTINLLFAILVFSIIAMGPSSYLSVPARVLLHTENSIAQAVQETDDDYSALLEEAAYQARTAGLQNGDLITKANGIEIANFAELRRALLLPSEERVELEILRDGRHLELKVPIFLDSEYGEGIIGIQEFIEPVVDTVFEGRPAALAGFEKGDLIKSVNGHEINSSREFIDLLQTETGQLTITVLRQGILKDLEVNPEFTDGNKKIGISFALQSYTQDGLPFFAAFAAGIERSFETISLTIRGLGSLFRGLNPMNTISGPIRIIYMGGEVAGQGFNQGFSIGLRIMFEFLALLSVALFFGNLLPIPVLDGGQILVYGVEIIRRKAISPKALYRYQSFGAIIVFALLIFAFFGDIMFLFQSFSN